MQSKQSEFFLDWQQEEMCLPASEAYMMNVKSSLNSGESQTLPNQHMPQEEKAENMGWLFSVTLASMDMLSFFYGKSIGQLIKVAGDKFCKEMLSGNKEKFCHYSVVGISASASTIAKFTIDGITKTSIVFNDNPMVMALAATGGAILSSTIVPYIGFSTLGVIVPTMLIAVIYSRKSLDHSEFYEAKTASIIKLGKDINGEDLITYNKDGEYHQRADVGIYLGLVKSTSSLLLIPLKNYLPASLFKTLEITIDLGGRKMLAPLINGEFKDKNSTLAVVLNNEAIKTGVALFSGILSADKDGYVDSLVKIAVKYLNFKYLSSIKELGKDKVASILSELNLIDNQKIYYERYASVAEDELKHVATKQELLDKAEFKPMIEIKQEGFCNISSQDYAELPMQTSIIQFSEVNLDSFYQYHSQSFYDSFDSDLNYNYLRKIYSEIGMSAIDGSDVSFCQLKAELVTSFNQQAYFLLLLSLSSNAICQVHPLYGFSFDNDLAD